MTKDYKKAYQWNRENKVFIGLSLSKSTDADIIGYIESKQEAGESKQGTVKKCIRYAMAAEEREELSEIAEDTDAKAFDAAMMDADIARGK